MPPEYAHKALTQGQKDTIRQWVAEGAKYEGHWAYQPVIRPSVPVVGGAKVLNPIDAFVQARLAKDEIDQLLIAGHGGHVRPLSPRAKRGAFTEQERSLAALGMTSESIPNIRDSWS